MHFFDTIFKGEKNRLAELLAQLLEMPNCKMNVLVLRAAEWALEGKYIIVKNLLSKDCSGSALLLLFF